MAASVRTRVVSWNDAAEMKLSVDREALVQGASGMQIYEPAALDKLIQIAQAMGFEHAACGPFVRSSYHADLQASGGLVK